MVGNDLRRGAPLEREVIRELEDRIADRLKVGGGVVITATLAVAVIEALTGFGNYHPKYRVILGLLAVGTAALALSQVRMTRRYATLAALSTTALILTLLTTGNVATHEGQAYITLNLLCVLLAGGIYPWGMGPQFVIVLVGFACLTWACSGMVGDVSPVSHDAANVVALAIAFTSSLFLARQHRAWRVAMLLEQGRLRHAEARLASVNSALERRVNERTGELEEAITDLSGFGYSVSHDLRQPLRAVCGFAQLLEQDAAAALGPAAREHLARIQTAALRMDRIIDELLRLSRLGSQRLQRESVDLSGLASSVAVALAANSSDRKVDWAIERGISATGDPGLLAVLIENLLGNSWKFTETSPRAHIEFGEERSPDGECTFFVRDNGCGFDESEAIRVFRPFTRLDNSEGVDGFGVGLATAQRIVHRHGGRIWATSEPLRGATFRFTLPDASQN